MRGRFPARSLDGLFPGIQSMNSGLDPVARIHNLAWGLFWASIVRALPFFEGISCNESVQESQFGFEMAV